MQNPQKSQKLSGYRVYEPIHAHVHLAEGVFIKSEIIGAYC